MKKNKKIENEGWLLMDYTESYFRKLRDANEDILRNENKSYLFFSYIILCTSTLEYGLNHILTTDCLHKFGPDEYKKYAETYINIRFVNKVHATPYIISNGAYRLNPNSSVTKKIEELITLRNNLVHKKEFIQPICQEIIVGKELSYKNQNYIDSISKDDCLKFGNAMGIFKEEIMDAYKFNSMKEGELIIKVDHNAINT